MYDYIRIRLRALPRSERGASAVEYGLLVALIAVIIIAAVTAARQRTSEASSEDRHASVKS